jgi:hypothetical protein
MMQYGGELAQNMQETGQARRPPLPARSIEPPCRRQGGLITYQEGRYER